MPNVAEAHIYKTLAKSKPISSSPAFPQWISTAPKTNQSGKIGQDIALNNVIARLYNSNPVKAAMADILKAVQIALGIENVENQKARGRRGDDKAQTFSSGRFALNSSAETGDVGSTIESGVGGKNHSSSSKAADVFSSEDEQKGSGTSKCDSRIAENENEEYGFGSDSEDGKRMPQEREVVSKVSNPEADLLLSFPPPESSSSNPPPLKSQKQKKPPTTPKSTFLPSLMGGYWSGSESAEGDGSADLLPQKNRMGQRARRQLWEKKFGAKANHLKGAARDKDWDPKRGAKAIDNRGGARPAIDGSHGTDVAAKYSRTGGRSGEGRSSDKPHPSAKKVDEGPLHPSWEAAKNAKKQAMQATFKGKKIIFD